MEKKTMGTFIAALRRAEGMTQQDLADKLCVSNKAVSRWERDECAPDISLIPAIAEMFGISCDELLRGERILNEASDGGETDRTDQKAEKVLKSIVLRSLERFKMVCIAVIAMSFVGYFACLGISYGAFRPILGVFVMMILGVSSMALLVVECLKLRSVNRDNELLKNDSALSEKCDSALANGSYISGIISITLMLISLPLTRGGAYAVITFGNYFILDVIIVLFVIFVALTFKDRYAALVTSRPYISQIGKKTQIMNGLQLLSVALSQLFYLLFIMLEFDEATKTIATVFQVLAISCFVLDMVIFVVFLFISREDKRRIAVRGIRNIILMILLGFQTGSVTYRDEVIFILALIIVCAIFKVIEFVICKRKGNIGSK